MPDPLERAIAELRRLRDQGAECPGCGVRLATREEHHELDCRTSSVIAELRTMVAPATVHERDRYRAALQYIAGEQSGHWGKRAWQALHPERDAA